MNRFSPGLKEIRWPEIDTAIAAMRRLIGVVLFAGILAGLLIAVQLIPEWQVKRASVRSAAPNPESKTTPTQVAALQNEMRKTFIQVVGGAFALVALYFTYRRVKVAEQGHITDRYTKAIEQLGARTEENKPNIEVRLGAIYALERIAFDSPRDHWTIMEVLTAYVRQNAPAPIAPQPDKENKIATTKWEKENKIAVARGPSKEIQAIVTVLGRRRRGRKREKEFQDLDLRDTDLRGAYFSGGHFERAFFNRSRLEQARLTQAHLEEARFYGTHLEGAAFFYSRLEGAGFGSAHLEEVDFNHAHLEGAGFSDAHLERANFRSAHLEKASFGDASVEGADFSSAHLRGANFSWRVGGLSAAQIKSSIGWELAQFDEALARELHIAKSGPQPTEAQAKPAEPGNDLA